MMPSVYDEGVVTGNGHCRLAVTIIYAIIQMISMDLCMILSCTIEFCNLHLVVGHERIRGKCIEMNIIWKDAYILTSKNIYSLLQHEL